MQTLEMKALLLTISFCLVAALQAQDSSSLAFNNENVSQGWATGSLSFYWYRKTRVLDSGEIPVSPVSQIVSKESRLIWS